MTEFAWYVWGSQWWHWFVLAGMIALLGIYSKTIWDRVMCLVGTVVVVLIGFALLNPVP